jgi:hypothetical protein
MFDLIIQTLQATDSIAQLPHVDPLVRLTTLLFTAAGTTIYQIAKKSVAPLDKLPGPIHVAIVLGANFLYQTFAPAIGSLFHITMPGDLSQVGPAVFTGLLSGLAMMGLHGLYKKVQEWVGGGEQPAAPGASPTVSAPPPRPV